MLSQKEIEQIIRKIKRILREEFMVDQIGYFGSFARGDFGEDSDVDIIVECKRGVGWKFFELKDYLETVLGKKVDLVPENSLRKNWRESILSQVKYI